MGFKINCPNCGERSYHEYRFGGELQPYDPGAGTDVDYANVWLHDNAAGPQVERWFHYAGCRRWLTLERDTRTNEIVGRTDLRRPVAFGDAAASAAPPADDEL
jgi:heterotetrameric sarcosine oxidase delta subunit